MNLIKFYAMVNIRFINAEDTYAIRREVLRKNIDLPYKLEGDFDNDTIHLGAYLDEELVSIVTLINRSKEVLKGEQFQLRGMGTLSEYRGKGYGKLLIRRSEEYLISRGIHNIWCNARIEAIGFYKSQNYNTIGESFNVPEIGMHYLMFKEL